MDELKFVSKDAERLYNKVRSDVFNALENVCFENFADRAELEVENQKAMIREAFEWFEKKFFEE